jgi:RNA polymerase sigma factor (sigma-70 family)
MRTMARGLISGSLIHQLERLFRHGTTTGLTEAELVDRFAKDNDEAAFEALIARHGPMVLGVCRQLLRDPNDVDDAFQATFLVLVSKAGSIRNRDSVDGWLFGIARRVAARARVEGARHRRHLERLGAERLVSAGDPGGPMSSEPEPDFAPLIAEVDRLPERFRAPVVLHYFEGLSAEATAQRLGCARGTVLSRLSRARGRIKARLERQGFSIAVLLPAGDALGRWLPPVPVPAWLAQNTVRAASSLGLAGAAIESVVSATVATLSRRVARNLVLSNVRVGAAIFLLAVAGVSIGLAATLTPDEPRRAIPRAEMARPPRATAEKNEPPAEEKGQGKTVLFRGRVVDPDGKPVAGAEILLGFKRMGPFEEGDTHRVAASGPDGRFEVAILREILDRSERPLNDPLVLSALVPGLGPNWVELASKIAGNELQIRLRPDDVPIEGHIIGLEGRPVAGVDVDVLHIWQYPPDFLKRALETGGEVTHWLWNERRNGLFLHESNPRLHARTARDGRFRLTGVGRDRIVSLIFTGDPIEQSYAMIFTTSDPAYKPLILPVEPLDNQRDKLLGPRFDLAVAPGRVIRGVIRDAETGRPVPGARVLSWKTGPPSRLSDVQGRFRLAGQPNIPEHRLEIDVKGQTYIKVVKVIVNPPGLEPIVVDINLRRGLTLEGKVMNQANGRAVKAVVLYFPFRDNPHLKDYPDAPFYDFALFNETEFRTDEDGHFRLAVLPGGGIVTVKTPDQTYLTARSLAPEVAGNVLCMTDFADKMRFYQALVPIDLPDGRTPVFADIKLVPGRPQRLHVVGPDGRPIAGTLAIGLQNQMGNDETVPNTDFTFVHRDPGKAERVVLIQRDQSLGAFVDIEGDEPDPIRVELQPMGTIIGRLVDVDSQPRPNIPLSVEFAFKARGDKIYIGALPNRFTTGPDGRFRITSLVPRIPFLVTVYKGNALDEDAEGYLKRDSTVKPGEVQDWGDVQVKSD